MGKKIKIADSIPRDVFEIRNVQKLTWLNTYPNKDLSITKEDIELNFIKDNTEEGKREIEEWKKRYLDPSENRWVAKDGDKIVGFCVVGIENNNGRIHAIYILPNYQGQGGGKRLMEVGLKWLGNDKDIYVNVVSYNDKAIRFYEKFGFVKTGKKVTDKVAVLPSGKVLPEIEMVRKT